MLSNNILDTYVQDSDPQKSHIANQESCYVFLSKSRRLGT